MRRSAALLGAAGLALAAAAPAGAAEVEVKALDASGTPAWDKTLVEVQPGDTVRWTFEGTTVPHNVMSASDNWSFRSELGLPAPAFTSQPLTTPGRYRFVCEVHQDTMAGEVVEVGGLDEERPQLRGVRVRRAGSAAVVRFRVSERGEVRVRVLRGRKVVKSRRVDAAGRRTLRLRGLEPGRYRVELRAWDLAQNPSAVATARLRIR